MILLDSIDTKLIFGVDIETVPIIPLYEDLGDIEKYIWRGKMKTRGVTHTEEELAELYKEEASFFPEFSMICAISVCFLNKDATALTCKQFYSETGEELETLLMFGQFIDKVFAMNPNIRLIGHAAKYFDYGFICKRFTINNLRLPKILDISNLKPWEIRLLCTNKDIWRMGFDGPGSSLVGICHALKLPISKNEMCGADVAQAYSEKRYEDIARYCSLDAISVINIVRKIKMEPIFQFDEVKYN